MVIGVGFVWEGLLVGRGGRRVYGELQVERLSDREVEMGLKCCWSYAHRRNFVTWKKNIVLHHVLFSQGLELKNVLRKGVLEKFLRADGGIDLGREN